MFIIPVPRLRVDRFADGPEDADAAEIVVLDVLRTEPAEETDGGRRGVKVRELVLVHRLPITRGRGIHGRRFEEGRGDAVAQGSVDDVAVKSRFFVILFFWKGSRANGRTSDL